MKLSIIVTGYNAEGAFHYIKEQEKEKIEQITNINHYLLVGDYKDFPINIGELWIDCDVLGMEWDGYNTLDSVEINGVKIESVDFSRVKIIEYPPLPQTQYVYRNTSNLDPNDTIKYPYVFRIIGREKGSNMYFANIDDNSFYPSKLSVCLRRFSNYYDGIILLAMSYDGEDMELQCEDPTNKELSVDIIKSEKFGD
ncbi:MAG: hypothetical protein KJ630_02590 [Proteobacteria bacterium]|nr:hypothetical protein [Pseudomonadota bacterium]